MTTQATTPAGIATDLLSRFLAESEAAMSQYHLTKPFVRGERQYWTDGRICIRITTSEPDTNDPKRRIPRADLMFAGFPSHDSAWQPWGEFACCTHCQGTTKEKCKTCHGKRLHVCECGNCDIVHVCGGCKGSGESDDRCTHCLHTPIQHAGQVLTLRYVQLVGLLPNPEFVQATNNNPIIFFRFTGGQGILAPRGE